MTASGLDSWYHEKESAWLYRRVAAAEPDPGKSELFLKLAAAAEEQAAKWQLAARRAGPGAHSSERVFVPSLRARIVVRLLSRFDPRSLRAVLAAMKLRGLSVYSAPAIVAGHPMPTSLAEVGARHRSGLGGSLRAGMLARPQQALDVLAREELGLNPDDLGSLSPAKAADEAAS